MVRTPLCTEMPECIHEAGKTKRGVPLTLQACAASAMHVEPKTCWLMLYIESIESCTFSDSIVILKVCQTFNLFGDFAANLAKSCAMVPEEEQHDGHCDHSCYYSHQNGNSWVHEWALPDMQAPHDNAYEYRKHSPKVELVHDFLRVVALSSIKVEGSSVTKQVEEHEGDRNQEVLLWPVMSTWPKRNLT